LIKAQFPKIDDAATKADIAANKSAYDAAMQADMQEGEKYGITGTPDFITGTTDISGAQPFATFQAAIDPQLK
jgi:protein-disulfide isomerase